MCKYILYIYNIYICIHTCANPCQSTTWETHRKLDSHKIGQNRDVFTTKYSNWHKKNAVFVGETAKMVHIYIYIVGFYYILLFYLLGTICSIYLLLPTKLQFLNQTSGPIPARSQGVRSPWFRDELQHTVQTTTAMATESMVMPMSCGAGRAADNFQASLSSGNFGMVAMGKRKRNKLSR